MATIRRTRGDDIDAACGQLVGKVIDRTTTRLGAKRIAVVAAAALASGVASAQSLNPEAARANVQLGVAYMQQGNLALAKEKLERALKQAPKNVEVHTALAYLNERLDKPQKAEEEYEAATRLAPNNSEVRNNYAVYLCRNGKVDKAMAQFDAAAKDRLYATPWAALTNAAICLRTSRRAPDAVRYLDEAIRVRPDYAAAVFELADLQLELGAAGVAGQVVDRFLALGLVSPDVLHVGVRAALAREDRPAAQIYVRRLRRDFSDSVQTRSLPQLLGEGG
jgi:type IV pilus assembly protein PilF